MPNWRNIAGLALGFTALSVPAFALPEADSEAPLHYIGSVEFMPDAGAIGAGWTIIIKDAELNAIQFALNASFGTAIVTGPGVQAHHTTLDPHSDGAARLYSIDLAPPVNGSPRIVKFSYGGPMFPAGSAVGINTLDVGKIELTVDSYWFPFDARFDTELTAQVNVRINGEWSAVGIGSTERTHMGYHFEQDEPAIDIALSLLSNSVKVMAPGYVIYDARPEPGAKLTELTAALEGCTAYLNALSGSAGPLPHASVIVTDRPEGGYSRGTLIALTDIENEDEEGLRQFICHELAHYWSKANAGGPENWINEGVADYLANMAVRDAMGDDVFDARMTRYADQLSGQSLPAIWSPNMIDRSSYLTLYRAAPLALRDLETRMGKDQFILLMQRIMAARVKTTQEFLHVIELSAGKDIRDWFEGRLGA